MTGIRDERNPSVSSAPTAVRPGAMSRSEGSDTRTADDGTDPTGARRAPVRHARQVARRASSRTGFGVLAVVGLVVVCNLIWIVRDHQAPPWDQAHYLHLSWQWRHALTHAGLRRAVSAFYHTDPAYAPLYMLVITPFEAIRNGVHAALVANTLMLAGTVLTVATVATRLYGRRAAFPAATLVATAPVIYGLSRTVLVDTLLVLLAALTVLAAVASHGFQDRRWAVACGVFAGLATLTKMTAPGIILAPVLLTLAWPDRFTPRRQLTNAAIAGAVAVAVALPWYVVNLNPALDYLRSTTSGQVAIGTTGTPLSVHAFLAFLSLTIDSGIGTILVVVAIGAGCLVGPKLGRRPLGRRDLVRLAIPASWFAVPFAALAVSHNQDVRYLAPGVAGVAVLGAGAVAAIQPRVLRRVVIGAAAATLVLQFSSYVTTIPGTNTARLVVGPASFRVTIPLDGSPLANTRRPGVPDYATPIVEALAEDRSPPQVPLDVCLLESQKVVNGNTLGYVSEGRDVALTFTDLSYLPRVSAAVLATNLAGCKIALYIPGDSGAGRVAVLNQSSTAARITTAELASFDGPRRTFPVGDGLRVQLLRRAH
jgi:4-amino-4-deoxy-L-arabinose transferase-like glycosyltransferase